MLRLHPHFYSIEGVASTHSPVTLEQVVDCTVGLMKNLTHRKCYRRGRTCPSSRRLVKSPASSGIQRDPVPVVTIQTKVIA